MNACVSNDTFLTGKKSIQKSLTCRWQDFRASSLMTLNRKTLLQFAETTLSRCITNIICLVTLGVQAARTACLYSTSFVAKRSCKKSARFSKRGKESSTFIDNSNSSTTLAQCAAFGARDFGSFRLAIQSFGGLPQSVNFILMCKLHA